MNYDKVLFRKWKQGAGVIALFPYYATDPGNPTLCQSYEHIGQHGAANPYLVIQQTVPASSDEYADVMQELQSIGYQVEVVQRQPAQAYAHRCNVAMNVWNY